MAIDIPHAIAPASTEAHADVSALLMTATLSEVYKVRAVTKQSGALALEAMLGVPIIGGTPELDRVTHTTAAALRFACRTAAESLAQTDQIDERTLAQVRGERHPVVINGVGSIAVMGKVRRVIEPVFSRASPGVQISGPEHVAIARNSFGVPRKLANQHFPVMAAIMRYLHPGLVMRGNTFDDAKFTLAPGVSSAVLAFANPTELEAVIEQEKEKLASVNNDRKGKGRCPALKLRLAEATWDLMVDIQEAGLAVRPRDRLRYAGTSALRRLGLSPRAAA